MGILFAMRRANGDWFALDERGGFRVPVFAGHRGGMLARWSNSGMQLFKPVALDVPAPDELVPEDGVGETHFRLVDDPFTKLNGGHLIDRARLSLLVRDAA